MVIKELASRIMKSKTKESLFSRKEKRWRKKITIFENIVVIKQKFSGENY